jgi:hypothetical protein
LVLKTLLECSISARIIPLVHLPHCQTAADVHSEAGAQINRLQAPIKPCIRLRRKPCWNASLAVVFLAHAVNAVWLLNMFNLVLPSPSVGSYTLCCRRATSKRGHDNLRLAQSTVSEVGMCSVNRSTTITTTTCIQNTVVYPLLTLMVPFLELARCVGL